MESKQIGRWPEKNTVLNAFYICTSNFLRTLQTNIIFTLFSKKSALTENVKSLKCIRKWTISKSPPFKMPSLRRYFSIFIGVVFAGTKLWNANAFSIQNSDYERSGKCKLDFELCCYVTGNTKHLLFPF